MNVLDRKAIAAHVLRHLAAAQARGRLVRLDELACEIGVRRADLREIVSSLDAEGHVDATRCSPSASSTSPTGSMHEAKLRPVRNIPKAVGQSKVA